MKLLQACRSTALPELPRPLMSTGLRLSMNRIPENGHNRRRVKPSQHLSPIQLPQASKYYIVL